MSHSPSPWTKEDASNPMEWANVYAGDNRPICALYCNKPNGEEDPEEPDATDKANARLILAAPAMYALLAQLEDNQMQATGSEYKYALWAILNYVRGKT